MDCFELLSLPKSAALSEELLQEAYSKHSRLAHPDHGGSEQSAAEINAAYETLRAPEKRLKHLLELCAGEAARAWRTVPLDEAMMSLFSRLGGALNASGQFLEKKENAKSALAKALLANEEFQWRDQLEEIGFELEAKRQELETALRFWDAANVADEASWKELAAIQARFSYLARWQGQIRERLLALM